MMIACGNPMPPCKQGTQSCVDGAWTLDCVGESPPSAEICDGVDNDCDGSADEVCACSPGETQVCGSSIAPCVQGKRACVNGSWGPDCEGEIKPSVEQCDGVDNDCNGTADDRGDALCTGGKKCAGAQKCVDCRTDADCASRPAAACKENYCDTSTHLCRERDAAPRTRCSAVANGKCNRGACVGCIDASDCPGQDCVSSQCMKLPDCGDNVVDRGEQCDDGNNNDSDGCTNECKTNICGDRHWNQAPGSREACDIGDRSTFSDARPWDQWSCDASCRRRYVYTPCTQRGSSNTSDCPNAECYSDGYCYERCSGAVGSSCRFANSDKAGLCRDDGWCWLTCTPGASGQCPTGSACLQIELAPGNPRWLCNAPG